jgi:hypothetical protein
VPQHNGTSDKLLKKRAEAKDQMASLVAKRLGSMSGHLATPINQLYLMIDSRRRGLFSRIPDAD